MVTQTVRSLPAMQETRVQSLGWEDPLEKGMATHSSIFAWKVSWMEEAWQATVHGVALSQTQLSDFTFFNQRQKCVFLKSKLIKLCAMRIIDCHIITWTINISFSIFCEPLSCSESQSLLHCALAQLNSEFDNYPGVFFLWQIKINKKYLIYS